MFELVISKVSQTDCLIQTVKLEMLSVYKAIILLDRVYEFWFHLAVICGFVFSVSSLSSCGHFLFV